MYDRVLVITINSYYSKVPSTGTAVLLQSTVPSTAYRLQMYCAFFFCIAVILLPMTFIFHLISEEGLLIF